MNGRTVKDGPYRRPADPEGGDMGQPEEDFTPREHLAPEERDPEAPDVDAVEQAIIADPAAEEGEVHRGMEIADWDAIEQARVVDLEDDYDR